MNLTALDYIVIVMGLVHVLRCTRHGARFAVASFVGFTLGAGLALIVAPLMLSRWMDGASPAVVSALAAGITLLAGWLGMLLVGDAFERKPPLQPVSLEPQYNPHHPPYGPNDEGDLPPPPVKSRSGFSLSGFALGLATVVLVTGTSAHLAWQSGDPTAAKRVSESSLMSWASLTIPDSSVAWALDQFPSYVENATGIPVLPLDSGQSRAGSSFDVDSDAMTAVGRSIRSSVVKVSGTAVECRQSHEGSGFVIADQRVMTNAHVVAGVTEPLVQVGGTGRHLVARVVHFDPVKDIAVLDVPDLEAPALPVAYTTSFGAEVAAVGFPLGGPFHVAPGVIENTGSVRSKSIYGGAEELKRIHFVRAVVRSGNSGGPLIDREGQLVGVVFARSSTENDLGYALDTREVKDLLAEVGSLTAEVDPGSCRMDDYSSS